MGGGLFFPLRLYLPEEMEISAEAVKDVCPGAFTVLTDSGVQKASCLAEHRAAVGAEETGSQIFFSYDGKQPPEGYEVRIGKRRVEISYSKSSGAFYALVALWQMYAGEERLAPGAFSEAPAFCGRGFMLDVSRGKTPLPETLEHLVNLLARMRYNQFQLYMEGFSFAYPSFPGLWKEESSLSPEEIRHLDVFCRERFIELVPNQNALGHMAPWLAREEYASLAECEEGFSYGGFTLPATTLDPEDERSLTLVMQMADDLLSNVSSKRIHMGLDEPFELGFGKSRGKALGPVFCRYVSRLHGELAARGRQMMMWSDALHRFGATELDLPEDILFLEWGYEKEHPFGERCGRLKEAGKRFYVCPGTSSWNTFTGMTDNMLLNIDHAISAAKSFGAEGVLLTDWGDGNHMQQLPFSYGPVVYCGIRAWNPDEEISREKLGHLLDAYIFMDRAGKMGEIVLAAGDYWKMEELAMPCHTLAHTVFAGGIRDDVSYEQNLGLTKRMLEILCLPQVAAAYPMEDLSLQPESALGAADFLEDLRERLAETDLWCADGALTRRELENGIAMAEFFCRYRASLARQRAEAGDRERSEELEGIVEEYQRLWKIRNKEGGLRTGTEMLRRFE